MKRDNDPSSSFRFRTTRLGYFGLQSVEDSSSRRSTMTTPVHDESLLDQATAEAGASTEARPGEAGPPPGYGVGRVVRLFLRRWLLLSVWCLLCGAAAYFIGKEFSTPKWRSEGSIVYTPLTFPENVKRTYTAPNSETVTALVKSPKNMETLCTEFGLTMPTKLLAQQFTVTRPPNSDVLAISLDWAEPERGAAMVNRLMDLSMASVSALRRKRIEQEIAQAEATAAEAREQLVTVRAEHTKFLTGVESHDLKADLELLNREVTELNAGLNAARQRCDACAAEAKQLDGVVAGMKAPKGTPGNGVIPASARPGDASGEGESTLSQTYEQRLRLLRDSLQEERARLSELKKKIDAKQKEQDQLMPLAARGIAPRAEVNAIAGELQLLAVQRDNSEKAIRNWEEEVRTLPLLDVKARKESVRERHETAKQEIPQYEASIAAKRERIKEVTKLLRQEAPLLANLDTAENAADEQTARLAALRQLHRAESGEFAIISPATPEPHPVSSDRKKLTAAIFGVPVFLFMALLVGLDWLSFARRAEAALAGANIPLLTRADAVKAADRAKEFRRLALRISQQLPPDGKVLIFHAAAPGDRVEDLANEVGRYLGLRQEKVLGIDARLVTNPDATVPQPGLSDYLLGKERDLSALLRLPTVLGVDFLMPGRPVPSTDLLASRAFTDLLARVREEYDRVLVIGPPATETLECEMLATHADAILLVAGTYSRATSAELERFTRALHDGGAPLLGAALVP
jgi:uncharacterized protein involved in exopolysaccharide biosynthesis